MNGPPPATALPLLGSSDCSARSNPVSVSRGSSPRAADRCLDHYYQMWPLRRTPNAPLYELTEEFGLDPGDDHRQDDIRQVGRRDGRALGNLDAIVLAGVTTDCCVLSTALAAADAGVHVTVAADACAGSPRRTTGGPRRHGALQANDRRRPGGHPGIRGQMSTAVDRARAPCMASPLAMRSACRPS